MVERDYIVKSIDDAMEKCGKPHISSLPGDMRSNDVNQLRERKYTLLERVNQADKDYEDSLKKSEELKNDIEKLNDDKKEIVNKLKSTEQLLNKVESNFDYHSSNISELSRNVGEELYTDHDMPERDVDYHEVETMFRMDGIRSYFYKINDITGSISYRCRQVNKMFDNYLKSREPIDKKFLNKVTSDSKRLYNLLDKAYNKQKNGYAIRGKFVEDAEDLYRHLEGLKREYKSHMEYEKQIKRMNKDIKKIDRNIKSNERDIKKQDKESAKIKDMIDDYDRELSRLASMGI